MECETKKVKEQGGVMGLVTFTSYDIEGIPEAESIDKQLSQAVDMPNEIYSRLVARLKELCDFREYTFQNQVHLSGRSIFARLLVDDTTYTGEINYGALGTSTAVIADSDTTLTTEVARKGIATRSRTDDSVSIDFYYSKGDTNGTYEEFGCFVDGTATADTGQMFNRVLTGGWDKSATEAMTVSVQIDINAA